MSRDSRGQYRLALSTVLWYYNCMFDPEFDLYTPVDLDFDLDLAKAHEELDPQLAVELLPPDNTETTPPAVDN